MIAERFTGMRIFLIMWAGQTFSRFGTIMTTFALFNLWVWERTGQATALALVNVIGIMGAILASLVGGVLVDRFSRKVVMILGDGIAGLGTVVYLILYTSGQLEVWHLYAGAVVVNFFNQIHTLAYSAAVTMMVPKTQYARAGSFRFLTHYGAVIFAPPLAAVLYTTLGLEAIMIIDILTVSAAVLTVMLIHIPQPPETEAGRNSRKNRWTQTIYGFKYISRSSSLRTMMIVILLFTFVHDISGVLRAPMVLSRTNNNFGTLAVISAAAGIGGLIGAIYMSWRGGPKRRINGWLWGNLGAGVAKMVHGLGRGVTIWVPTQVASSINFPIRGGSLDAIWMSKIEPDIQGRFFAASEIMILMVSAIGQLTGSWVTDQWVEPAMHTGGALAGSLGWLFGTGGGAGFSLVYFTMAVCMTLISITIFWVKGVRDIEDLVVDYAENPEIGAVVAV
jgi:MFS family permease